MCTVYIFPLILYRLSVLPLPRSYRRLLQQSPSNLLWGRGKPMIRIQVCSEHLSNGVLGMPDLENHWFVKRQACQGWSLSTVAVWRRKARNTFPRLRSDFEAKGRRKPKGEALFTRECLKALYILPGSSNLFRSRKELYRELEVGSAPDPIMGWLSWSMEEVCSHWNLAPGSGFLNNSEFSLTRRLGRNALALFGLDYR